MIKKDFSPRILVGLTGHKALHWQSKLREINQFKLSKIALFLECFEKTQRKKIYPALLNSSIKEIPLVHIRHDMGKDELLFLKKNFHSSYFTIHEDHFKILRKWQGFYPRLFLEMNYDNSIFPSVQINKIGGFCLDLSHFKVEAETNSREFKYIMKRKKVSRYFACNHLNGYSPEKNIDLHTIKTLKDFAYLKTLPEFLFGQVIALEMENSISEQLRFKEYLSRLLNKQFFTNA